MSRISDIFLNVRDTLNDHQKERWADATLLRGLNQGIVDVATQTGFFKNSTTIPIKNGQEVYPLPKNLLELSHASYDWKPLPLASSGWMTGNREVDWRYTITETGPTRLVFDEVQRQYIRMYPRPFGDYDTEFADINSIYGVVVEIEDYDIDSIYGVTAALADPDVHADSYSDLYGVLVAITVGDAVIIYYTECPPLPTALDQDPPLDMCFDTALQHYTTAIVLRNDIDVQNRDMANEEFKLYARSLEALSELAETDSVSAPHFESNYNSMG